MLKRLGINTGTGFKHISGPAPASKEVKAKAVDTGPKPPTEELQLQSDLATEQANFTKGTELMEKGDAKHSSGVKNMLKAAGAAVAGVAVAVVGASVGFPLVAGGLAFGIAGGFSWGKKAKDDFAESTALNEQAAKIMAPPTPEQQNPNTAPLAILDEGPKAEPLKLLEGPKPLLMIEGPKSPATPEKQTG